MITCVIDACSYIYLHQSSFLIGGNDESLFSLLDKNPNIRIKESSIVHSEILKHFSKANSPESTLKNQNRIHGFKRKKKLSFYDQHLFGNTIDSSTDDAGEKANLAVCLDLFNSKNNQSIIFLSDDKKALNTNGIKESIPAFPYFLYWTSFDVILFLYQTKHRKYDLKIAKNSIQDIVSFLSKGRKQSLDIQKDKGRINNLQYSQAIQKMRDEYQRLKIDYISRLELITKIL